MGKIMRDALIIDLALWGMLYCATVQVLAFMR
jgi:hypothetical protein